MKYLVEAREDGGGFVGRLPHHAGTSSAFRAVDAIVDAEGKAGARALRLPEKVVVYARERRS